MSKRDEIVEIALSQVGYEETPVNITKYGEWFGMQDEWCDMFVCWCANQVGVSENIIPKLACCDDTGEWFDERGLYRNSYSWGGDYYPQKGDLILFDWDRSSDSDHIGIVTDVDRYTVYTVEGNKDNAVRKCEYSLGDDRIRAFCLPAYPDAPQPSNKEIKPRLFKNNGQARTVYEDLWLTIPMGELNPNEECNSFGTFAEKATVLYEIDGTDHNWKIGFCDYPEGVQ